MPLRRVAVARQHEPLRVEPLDEHVADRVERGEMGAGDDELREPGCGEGVQVDLRIPDAALDDQGARSLLERRRQGGGRYEIGADEGEEAAQERFRIVGRARLPPLDATLDERVDDGVPPGDVHRRRLDHGQRPDRIRNGGCREQRDHAAVGVTDEVGAVADRLGDESGVVVEVDVLDRRIRREPGRSRISSRKRSPSSRCPLQVGRPPMTLPWTKTIRGRSSTM